jgi:hypothetical protein
VDAMSSGSCPKTGLGTGYVEPLGSATIILLLQNYFKKEFFANIR